MDTKTFFEDMLALYKKKNADYGNNAHKTFVRFGTTAYAVRMFDKANRIDNLREANTVEVNEAIADTIMDLAAYALMCAGDMIAHIADTSNEDMTMFYMRLLSEESPDKIYEAANDFKMIYIKGGSLNETIVDLFSEGGSTQFILLAEYMATEYIKEMDKE